MPWKKEQSLLNKNHKYISYLSKLSLKRATCAEPYNLYCSARRSIHGGWMISSSSYTVCIWSRTTFLVRISYRCTGTCKRRNWINASAKSGSLNLPNGTLTTRTSQLALFRSLFIAFWRTTPTAVRRVDSGTSCALLAFLPRSIFPLLMRAQAIYTLSPRLAYLRGVLS